MTPNADTPETIDAYIAGCPPSVREILAQVRATIRDAAPSAVEAITYRIPTFVQHGNPVHVAAYRRHNGV